MNSSPHIRYNKDGSTRPETRLEQLERENLNANGGGGGSARRQQQRLRDNATPWLPAIDQAFFSFPSLKAGFRRFSDKYNDFKEFYKKLLQAANKASKGNTSCISTDDPVKLMEKALALFADFNDKKQRTLAAKILKDRSSLPIKTYQQQILDAVKLNPVVLVAADTGAGKSTQVPQYLLEAGYDKIAVTQPRRIACYSLARRVAHEQMNTETSEIAYKVRFEGTSTSNTKVLFLTEGVLLRQFASDPNLATYNVIIIDEVHERHINGDFLLGILKRLIMNRNRSDISNNLKIILMSATINISLFSTYFSNAPVIQVPGRLWPVNITYLPFEKDDRNLVDERIYAERVDIEKNGSGVRKSVEAKSCKIKVGKVSDPYLKILDRIDQTTPSDERGDCLIFLSGINEIMLVAEELRVYANSTKKWIILLLHSTLSVADQEKVFDISPPGMSSKRDQKSLILFLSTSKGILSTNIAETSVTIDGVRFIVDSGKVKEMNFDAGTGLSRLSEFWISQSSAKQRTGRAGRTGPGECFRLYSQNEYNHMIEFPIPEILRSPLEPLLLQISALSLERDPRDFDFIERPATDAMTHALHRLANLDALDIVTYSHSGISSSSFVREDVNITPLGRVLSLLPVDVVLGKMLLLGSMSGDLVDPTLVMAATLSVSSPFVRVNENDVGVNGKRAEVYSDHGDPFTLLNLYSDWLKIKADKSESSRNWCRRRGVEEQRLYEIVKLKTQFESILNTYMRSASKDEEEGGSGDEEEYDMMESLERDNDYGESSGASRKRRRQLEKEKEEDDEFDWTDPEKRKIRFQKHLLKRKKRMQNAGKRKVLRFEEEMVVTTEGEVESSSDQQQQDGDKEPAVPHVEDVTQMSVDELEFTLKHDATALFQSSDVGNLSNRDVNLLKLILCSGMYPNLALPDDANPSRKPTEQFFHTKSKRFLSMHPTSVFASNPDLLFPKQMESISATSDVAASHTATTTKDGSKETLDSLHAQLVRGSELLCYLELLETTKPYLCNVFRVPALPACLLFSKKVCISPNLRSVVVDDWLHIKFHNPPDAEKVFILGSSLRYSWDTVVKEKLEAINKKIKIITKSADMEKTKKEGEEEVVPTTFYGTKLEAAAMSSEESTSNLTTSTSRIDFSTFPDMIPACFARIRQDWQQSGIVDGEVEVEDVMDQLGEFLALNELCVVERLRTQDLSSIFGYDVVRHTPEFVQDRFIQVTPHFQYFVDTKHVLSTKHLECLGRLEKTVAVAKHLPPPLPTPLKNPNYGMLVSTEEEIITRAFKCNACGGFYTSTPRQRQAGKTTVGSRRQSCFAVEEPGAGDRRGNKSELTIANYNAEWLFLSPSHPSGAMKCPGKDCTWKVGGVLAWGGVKKPLRTGEKPLVFSDSLLIPHFKYNKPFKSLDQAEQHLQSVALVVEQLGFPDILHLSEVQDCQTLDRLVEALHGKLADSPYRAYMIRGTDTATGQNVGLITKIDPVSDLRRSGDRAEYPLDGSKCGYSEPIDGKRSTGVSKHYFTDFLINGQHKILLVGAHLIAFPSKRDRCEKREAQATLLANHIQKTVALSDTSIIIMGDFNDFDGEIDDAAGEADKPISSTLDILKKSTNPPLVNIASTWTNTTKRYSSWYDRNKSCKDDGGNEHTLIDHILVSSNLSAILVESYPLHSYKEFCGTLNSDHWPIFARFRLGDNYAQEDSGNEL